MLTRAIRTANIVLEDMGLLWVPFHKTWRLNERMCVLPPPVVSNYN